MESASNALIPLTDEACAVTTGIGAPSEGAVVGEAGLRRTIHANWSMSVR